MTELLKTPLHQWHVDNKAKMAPFAGFDMPIQYTGIIAEHHHTREAASLFDICHMGEFMLRGDGARDALGRVVSHNLETLAEGKCRYGFLLNTEGGVLDDLIVYCLRQDTYMLVVNGACRATDFKWIRDHLPEGLEFQDISEETSKIDLQGPASLEVLEAALGADFHGLKYFNFVPVEFNGVELLVSRTGYTGELGYELYGKADRALPLWERLMAQDNVAPAGLGARDTLRLEIGYPLYGQDLDIAHTPAEAGYEMLLSSPAEYVGKGEDREVRQRLIPLALEGRRSARTHDIVLSTDGVEVGEVTSGSFAPSLGHAVALAYIKDEASRAEQFIIRTGKKDLPATRTDLPFYRKGTARMKVDG